MDKVRVLKWKPDLNGWWKAVTLNGTWYAHDEGHWRLAGGQWSGQVSDGNLSTAQDLCESDYIARCSEFLRVAGPGEVVISIETANSCMAALDDPQRKKTNPGDPTAYGNLTAAIDAAGGEE